MPKKSCVIGAGYIGVEMAGILHALGSDTTFIIRKDKVLRNFDSMLSENVTEEIKASGMKLITNSVPESLSKNANGLIDVKTTSGEYKDFDIVLNATGRIPNTDRLDFYQNAKEKVDEKRR